MVKSLGVVSPFLTCIVYIAVALARDLSRIESKQSLIDERQARIEDESRQWQRDKERLAMEMKHRERLAKIQAVNVKQTVDQTVNQTSQAARLCNPWGIKCLMHEKNLAMRFCRNLADCKV